MKYTFRNGILLYIYIWSKFLDIFGANVKMNIIRIPEQVIYIKLFKKHSEFGLHLYWSNYRKKKYSLYFIIFIF